MASPSSVFPLSTGRRAPPTTKGLTRFELACLESHRTAWRKFLASADSLACFLEDDVHVQPGFAALLSEAKWPPKDAHAVKLDTYFQKVRLGERRSASGGREIARLYSRHESAAAYILSRDGAARYLELTESASQPADYAVFPNSPRRLGLNIYQLVPAIAIQDHLLKDGKRFATAMTKTDARAAAAPFIGCWETGARERATRRPGLEPWRVGLSEGVFAGRDDDSRT